MTFEDVVDQALAMVQRRGRVTYRMLQLQFALDDNRLEALKDALLFAHYEITDECDHGLVWTGTIHTPTQIPQLETDWEKTSQQGQNSASNAGGSRRNPTDTKSFLTTLISWISSTAQMGQSHLT